MKSMRFTRFFFLMAVAAVKSYSNFEKVKNHLFFLLKSIKRERRSKAKMEAKIKNAFLIFA